MRILLVTGIAEELNLLFDRHTFDYQTDIRAYRSQEHRNLFATTSGPGLSRRRELRKLMEVLQPDLILNAGLVGILNIGDRAKPGELIKLNTIIDASENLIYPGGPGSDTLVTIDAPLFALHRKMELYYEYNHARAYDMEAGKLLRFTGGIESISTKTTVIFCKTVGDLALEADIYKNESLLHGWSRAGIVKKMKIFWSFPGGPLGLRRLRRAKEFALEGLTEQIDQKIIRLIESGNIPHNMDSVFIPH
jgi:hypothetical protein